MESMNIRFAFGKAFGNSKFDIEKLKKEYGAKCGEISLFFRHTPFETEGYGWITLGHDNINDSKEAGTWLAGYDAIVYVGIGGSALGPQMLNQALLGDFFNDQTPSTPKRPHFFLADNPDPSKTRAIWEQVKNGTVALVGVSKSGATAETMSQFLWFREQLRGKNPGRDPNKDILVITDPEKGFFRSYARESGCRRLDLPSSVGGRYSVLSPVGLVSAAALGIDVDALIDGAADMAVMLYNMRSFPDDPAHIMATLLVQHAKEGRNMAVLMPYSSKLERFTEWFAQLLGESLGKEGQGITPVRALGAIDQHSQVQLYTEGPDDKFYTLLNVRDHGAEVYVPMARENSLGELSYMNGAELGEMLRLEAQSTAAALVKAGRPVAWIEIDRIDARTIGGLVFFYESVVAVAGKLMGINPFDQPGVEQGKRYTYGLMGRDGYKKDAKEAKRWFDAVHSKIIDL